MGVIDQEKADRIKNLLKWRPRGMTISDISSQLSLNRNLVAKILDMLLIAGQVEMHIIGAAKVYFLSQRVPIATILEFSADLVIVLDRDNRILQVNEKVSSLLDIPRQQLIGKILNQTDSPFLKNIPLKKPGKQPDIEGEPIIGFTSRLKDGEHHFRMKPIPTAFEDGTSGLTLIIEDVTTEKRYERMLIESEERFRNIAEISPFPMLMTDADGRTLFANRSFITTFGYNLETIPDIASWLHFAFSDFSKNPAARDFWIPGPQPGDLDNGLPIKYSVSCGDGRLRQVYFTAALLPRGIRVFIGRDVTAEEEAFRVRDHLASIIQSSGEAIIGKTVHGLISSWNPAAEQLLGYSSQEMIGEQVQRLVPSDSRGDLETLLYAVIQGDCIRQHETRMLRKDGMVIEVSVSISPIREESGKIVGISSIIRDITREKMERHLRQFEDRYRTLVEDLNVGIYRSTGDPHGRFVWGNTALLNILGYQSMIDLEGVRVVDIFSEPGGRKELIDELIRSGFVKNRILQLKRKDQSPITVSVTALAEFDENKNVVFINGIVQNISEVINTRTGFMTQ